MSNLKSIAAGELSDGRIQVFAIDNSGNLQSRWKETTDPNSSWTNWSNFQTPSGGVISLGVGTLPDKRLQLFGVDSNGNPVSCWKITVESESAWTPWSGF